MMDADVARDPTWKHTPIGQAAQRWIDSLRWQDASPNTIDAYTVAVARLALDNPHLTVDDLAEQGGVGEATIRLTLKRWDDSAPATRRLRLAAIRSFTRWCVEEGLTSRDPAEKIRAPRRRKSHREAHANATLVALIGRQDSLRDRCCLQLMCRLGLRRNELRLLQIRDIRLDTGELHILHGKGGKVRTLPIRALPTLRDELAFHILVEERQPREYLLHPWNDRLRPMDGSSVHRWFQRCLNNADLPQMPMHELRHTAADSLYRATHDLTAVQMMLGHDSLGTTQAYLHPSQDDLAAALEIAERVWASEVLR